MNKSFEAQTKKSTKSLHEHCTTVAIYKPTPETSKRFS